MNRIIANLGRWLGIVTIAVVVIGGFYLLNAFQAERGRIASEAPTSTPVVKVVTSTPTPSSMPALNTDEDEIQHLFTSSPRVRNYSKIGNYQLVISKVKIADGWATIDAYLLDKVKNTPAATSGTLILGHKTNGTWNLAFKGTDLYDSWLDSIPSTLISPDIKPLLR